MKVLLVTIDLFKSIGGGQTVYKKIIEATPDIQFFYFRDDEQADSPKPVNAQSIPLLACRRLRMLAPSLYASYRISALEEADRFARSAAGQTFDVVDIPDFYSFGSLLRNAFAHHQVKVGRVVLAMHGNISKSLEMSWDSANNEILEGLHILEQHQFDAADGAYAISPRYIREWQAVVNREVHYIDPAHFVAAEINTAQPEKSDEKPAVYCIGRSERRKGNDLFVELVRWLNKSTYSRVAHIGDQVYSNQGISSSYLLRGIAKQRNMEVESLPAMNSVQLSQLFAERSIVVLPVRYDTLNLVALEALFSGCPVAISTRAGVCDYLDENHPGLPYVKIDFDNFYAAVSDLQNILDNYDKHRRALLDYLTQHTPSPRSSLNIDSIYQAILSAPARCKSLGDEAIIHYEVHGLSHKRGLGHFTRRMLSPRAYHALRCMVKDPKHFLVGVIRKKLQKSEYFGDAKYFGVIWGVWSTPRRLRQIAESAKGNMGQLREKLNDIYSIAGNPLYRCNFWLAIARIERILGNELIAVTYELRILRLLGDDRLGLLPNIMSSLGKLGFTREAKAVQAMYAEPKNAEKNVYAYLKEAYQRNLIRQDKPFQVLDDRRNEIPAKVAIIVSLYKAAEKLNFFLTALSQQTLVKQDAVEIILVDSGSPTNERGVIETFMDKMPLNAVYARSAERETIQAAWNRGIGLAKAPYLVFLGVDETLYPEGLEVLANELDQNPDVDWVMANSLVTAVEESGVNQYDIMTYDRTGATKDHVYLETCYLSWVGGMYRKTLHERFGYYDETFGAAGDTEIKNRIMPYINVKFIPQMLGLFLNYPDGQTTASPKAEIEDLRAWYLHRTPGGVRYAFENRPVADAEKLLCLALGYRKSYCEHMSCDIEYASYLAQYIKARNPDSTVTNPVLPGLKKMLSQLRKIEFEDSPSSRLEAINILVGAWRAASQYQTLHREQLKSISWPCYNVLNDNRYEQHSWLWKSV